MDNISSSSLVTIMRAFNPVSSAASIVQQISGFPASGRTFLRGNRLLPPRAGITISLSLVSVIKQALHFSLGLVEIIHSPNVQPVLMNRKHIHGFTVVNLLFQ